MGLRTPLATLTAVRENDPVAGNADKNDPITLVVPTAIIS